MSNKSILAAMATLALISCNSKEASKYAQDTFKADLILIIHDHYAWTDIPTDLDALEESLKDVTKVLIRPLE